MLANLVVAPNDQDWQKGNPNGAVTVIEYGDFQCPDCGAAYAEFNKVMEELGDQVLFIYRHFPLTDIHENALLAAQAAEAAGAQGKFWEMHDLLYENQPDLDREDLLEYGRQLDLDMDQFEEALRSGRYLEDVRSDVQGAARGGVQATPTVFVDGEQYPEEVDADALAEYIRREAGLDDEEQG